MRSALRFAFVPVLVALGGCYHVIVDTGRPANGTKIEKPWANSFVYGLVPPPPIETAAKCPNGVAKVETQETFLNGLVAALTAGIYTPWSVTVSCASAGTASRVRMLEVGRTESTIEAVQHAAQQSVSTGEDVYLKFER
jgi:hypothetical protein